MNGTYDGSCSYRFFGVKVRTIFFFFFWKYFRVRVGVRSERRIAAMATASNLAASIAKVRPLIKFPNRRAPSAGELNLPLNMHSFPIRMGSQKFTTLA